MKGEISWSREIRARLLRQNAAGHENAVLHAMDDFLVRWTKGRQRPGQPGLPAHQEVIGTQPQAPGLRRRRPARRDGAGGGDIFNASCPARETRCLTVLKTPDLGRLDISR